MKKTLLAFCAGLFSVHTFAQITLTSADMPVLGDTLRYTNMDVNAAASLDLTTTGASTAWDFSTALSGVSQGMDNYRSVMQVNPAYSTTYGIPADAYGTRVDGIPGLSGLPVQVDSVYTFFKLNATQFDAVGFAALVDMGLGSSPLAGAYSANDRWYLFPMTYENMDTNAYRLDASITGLGSLIQEGTRYNHVDGWGTITTPYYTTPVPCIRLRSEIVEVDTAVMLGGSPTPFERHTVEYKWLVNGDHAPALWVITDVSSGTPSIISVRYRDLYRPDLGGIENTDKATVVLRAYPNPAHNGVVTLEIPASWNPNYQIELFDVTGKLLMTQRNNNSLNLQTLPAGQYIVRVLSGNQKGYVPITR
jgi:hypothetical protein